MLFACFFIATAVAPQNTIPVEVKIHYMRASKALDLIKQSYTPSLRAAQLEADDAKGVVSIQGSQDNVQEVRQYAKLIDHPRRKLSVKVTVDSEADKESYQVSAKIMENQKWKTSDGDTGVTVAVQPRINADRTITMFLVCERAGSNSVQETLRVKAGTSRTFTIGSQVSKEFRQQTDGTFKLNAKAVPDPKITIRVDL
jgi:type II secretory pathway component GspD/PulD (secretin)